MRIFNIDGPLFSFLNKMADLCILNLLFLLCCLPVITIGASYTALYTMTLKMAYNKEGYIAKGFFKAFKDNFKQSTLIFIPALLVIFFMLADIRIFSAPGNSQYRVLLIGAYLILFLTAMFLLFVFPITAKFSNTTIQTVKNTFFMELRHLPYTVCVFLIAAVPAIITVLLPKSLSFVYMLWLLFGFSLTAYGNSFIFAYKIFPHYIDNEED